MSTNRHEYNSICLPGCSSATTRRIFVSLVSAARGAATTLLIFSCVCFSSFAQAPLQFSYQGRLTDSNGIPVTTSVTGVFRIVKGGSVDGGGQEVYGQTNGLTPDPNGVFSVTLGTINPISLSAIYDGTSSNRFIEAVINDQTNLPRQQLLSVPYAIHSQSGNPPGTILAYAGETLPEGYLWCDAASYSTNQYPLLYKAIGKAWGSTNTSYFNVPDTRGLFLRGVVGSSSPPAVLARDPDVGSRTPVWTGANSQNNVGSFQGDIFKSHTHGYTDPTIGNNTLAGQVNATPAKQWPFVDNGTTAPVGGSETRPKNVYVNYIIKY